MFEKQSLEDKEKTEKMGVTLQNSDSGIVLGGSPCARYRQEVFWSNLDKML